MMPSLRKSATLAQTDTWRKDSRLRLHHHACIAHIVEMVNCLCLVRSCATCWCPYSELVNGHSDQCQYSRMAEVMEELDAARTALLDEDDELVGCVKDVKGETWRNV
jgi:hypothetical protein